MAEKRWENYLDEVLSFVKFKYDHRAIRRELEEHMEDVREELLAEGMEETAADVLTIAYMGDAAEIGQALDKEHRALLGWIWRVTRALVILLVLLNGMPLYDKASGMVSNLLERYEPPEGVTEVWRIQLDKAYKINDDTLILEDIYYYDDGTMDVVYRTKRNPFAKSIAWSFTISLEGYDSAGKQIGFTGGGFKQGGCYGMGCATRNDVPEDIKTLRIYCAKELTLLVDLETGEVTEYEET